MLLEQLFNQVFFNIFIFHKINLLISIFENVLMG